MEALAAFPLAQGSAMPDIKKFRDQPFGSHLVREEGVSYPNLNCKSLHREGSCFWSSPPIGPNDEISSSGQQCIRERYVQRGMKVSVSEEGWEPLKLRVCRRLEAYYSGMTLQMNPPSREQEAAG